MPRSPVRVASVPPLSVTALLIVRFFNASCPPLFTASEDAVSAAPATFTSSVPPLMTAAPEPSAPLLVASRTPAATVTPPVKVFAALSTSRPVPVLLRLRAPPVWLMAAPKVSPPAPTSMLPLAPSCTVSVKVVPGPVRGITTA